MGKLKITGNSHEEGPREIDQIYSEKAETQITRTQHARKAHAHVTDAAKQEKDFYFGNINSPTAAISTTMCLNSATSPSAV